MSGARTTMPGRVIRRAFSLVELLVVISVFILLLAIAIPAFNTLIYTSDQSLAENSLRSGLAAARDTAIASSGENDAAAVFFFQPGGRTTIVTYVRVGVFQDADPAAPNDVNRFVERDVFVPAPDVQPVQLPGGWMVRAYAPAFSLEYPGNPTGWYDRSVYDPEEANWIFPETGFFDQAVFNDGRNRQTFMVRFQAGTGLRSTAAARPALVLAPRPTALGRGGNGWERVDRATDLRRWAQRVISDQSLTVAQRRGLIGSESGDVVLAAPVPALAVYNERRLASALGVRLDAVTGTVYREFRPSEGRPELVNDAESEDINSWLLGELRVAGSADEFIETDARIFSLQRYQAGLSEVSR